jgi:large subunit ribosomal protein L21
MYALVEFAGKQFKVEEGAQIKVPLVTEKVGGKVNLDKVLYFDDGKNKVVGTPFIDGMSIDAKVEEHGRDRKIVVFKFKRRKGYQRKNGHRQQYSVLSVGKLGAKKKAKAAPKKTTTKKAAAKKTTTKKTTTKKKKD